MPKYHVKVQETHYTTFLVEAENEEQAKDTALTGEGEIISTEYSHSDPDKNNYEVKKLSFSSQ